jgi:hypothetical protein
MKRERNSYNIKIRGVARGIPYPSSTEGWENIPAWSRGAYPWNQLSPFIIKGFDECNNFESWWQSFKVWKKVDARKGWDWTWPAETHAEEDIPNEQWHKWHQALLKNPHPVRRPNGRAIPLYAWWEGRKLGIIEARKEIYIPYLQKRYRESPIYQKLLEKVKSGQNIIILEPDGPNPTLFPDGMNVDLDLLIHLQNVTKMADFPKGKGEKYVPYGHGYVIALTLLEDLERDGNFKKTQTE